MPPKVIKTKKTIAERLAARLRTPRQVQRYLRGLPYNREVGGETLASAQTGLKRGQMHCFEAALAAAAILEHHGYPPLVLSLESQDLLDHVLYVFQQNGKWGAIGRSRDDGLNGRAPVYRSVRDLVWSYYDPYVDKTGRITGYQVANLDDMGCDWRASPRNVWKAQTYLIDLKHKKLKSSKARYQKLKRDYLDFGAVARRAGWW